ncbi:Zinc/iron permease [Xylariales sp. PMI_506]|nr:Zinc/iron permease [Xylariales sp. PMI_506]
MSDSDFDPNNVDLDTVDPTEVICYLNAGGNDYNGQLGARVSALFVILVVSTAFTFFPVLASRVKRLRIPVWIYIIARYFGSGVIIATAFIHLLDPAYDEIGPASCVGMTGGWAEYSWPPAIALTSIMVIFLIDFLADWFVEGRYGRHASGHVDTEGAVTTAAISGEPAAADEITAEAPHQVDSNGDAKLAKTSGSDIESFTSDGVDMAFREQIAAFLILEFGVLFHSVIIGLNLGVVGDEFATLYPVLVFHQSFEGLGIGARLSAIPFPRHLSWMPWALCLGYGLTTPISIAIGLGLRTTYDSGSYTANVVSGVLDSISAGILIYTGLVEMLARDFIFNPERTRDKKRITLMLVCLYLGIGVMALLGKWA